MGSRYGPSRSEPQPSMSGAPSWLICPGARGVVTLESSTLIEGGGCLSQKTIAHMPGVHHETIKRVLRDGVNMRKVNFKLVSHALKSSQKAVRVQVSREPLEFLESRTGRSLSTVYTGDVPGLSSDVHVDRCQCRRPTRVRRILASKKRVFWIDFTRTGVGTVVTLPADQRL
jgi:hypothetical protein